MIELALGYALELAFLLWVIFFGGDKWMEGTFVGFLRFGRAAESAEYVRIVAWVLLVGSTVWFGLEIVGAMGAAK